MTNPEKRHEFSQTSEEAINELYPNIKIYELLSNARMQKVFMQKMRELQIKLLEGHYPTMSKEDKKQALKTIKYLRALR